MHLPDLEAEATRLVSELGPVAAYEKVQEEIVEAKKRKDAKVRRYMLKVLQMMEPKLPK